MSRPQKVSDQELLRAAYDLIMDQGPGALTFSRLGEKVGLVPAAVAKRFTTKRRLLAEIDRYALKHSLEALQAAMQRYDSPTEALIASMAAELAFISSIKRFVNGQSFLLHDLMDPDLYANYRISFQERRHQITRLLEEAQDRQEIIREVNTKELAELLQTIQHGAGHVWAMSPQQDSIQRYIEQSVRIALRPYAMNQPKEE